MKRYRISVDWGEQGYNRKVNIFEAVWVFLNETGAAITLTKLPKPHKHSFKEVSRSDWIIQLQCLCGKIKLKDAGF